MNAAEDINAIRLSTTLPASQQILNVTCTVANTNYPITFAQPVKNFALQSRTAVDAQFRVAAADTTYFTVKSGQSMGLDIALSGVTVGYVQSGTAGTVVEVIGTF